MAPKKGINVRVISLDTELGKNTFYTTFERYWIKYIEDIYP